MHSLISTSLISASRTFFFRETQSATVFSAKLHSVSHFPGNPAAAAAD
jgi:hypothetical protein